MAEVNTIDGESTGARLCKWKFTGSPEDMFEHHPRVGEIRVLTITVECTATGTEMLAAGTREFASFKVREANTGTVGTLKGKKGAGEIPGQMSVHDYDENGNEIDPDGPRPDLGDYQAPSKLDDYRPEEPDGDWAPPADAIFSDGASS